MNTVLSHIEEQIDSVIDEKLDEKLTEYLETTIRDYVRNRLIGIDVSDYVDVESIVEDVIAEEL